MGWFKGWALRSYDGTMPICIVRQSGYVDSVEKSYQDAETVGQQGEGWLGESLVLAQRAVSEDPRWTRAVRDSSGPY